MAKQIIEIKNRSVSQISEEDGIIDAVKRLKFNERLSFIDDNAVIGKGCKIFQFVNIYGPAKIGDNVLISSYVSIQGEGTSIGNNCRVGDYTFIPAWTVIEDGVFLGSHVSICNDKLPKAHNKDWKKSPVIIRKNSSIGSGCIILPGIEVGENCMLGAGSILTKNMPNNSTWVGNPAAPISSLKQKIIDIVDRRLSDKDMDERKELDD